jgi:hypothetical protein
MTWLIKLSFTDCWLRRKPMKRWRLNFKSAFVLSSIIFIGLLISMGCRHPQTNSSESKSQSPSLKQDIVPVVTAKKDCSQEPPCANQQPRNQWCVCGAMPSCPKKCTWKKSAPAKDQCWTYLGKNTITGYDNQLVNGKPCAYAKAD